MRLIHPEREILARFLRGQLAAGETRRLVRHLLGGCTECGRAVLELRAGGEAGARGDRSAAPDYGASFERVIERVRDKEAALEAEKLRAPRLCEDLEHHPLGRQLILVRNTGRHRTWAVCELLLERSHEAGFRDPAKAVALAEVAVAIAEQLPAEQYGGRVINDLRSRAWAVLGNARRIVSDLDSADAAFRCAENLLAEGTGDPLEEARVLALTAVLRSDQRRFDECCRLLDRAIAIYRRAGDRRALGRSLIRKGTALGEAGDFGGANALLRGGTELIDPDKDRRWLLAARHNEVLYLSEAGRQHEACRLLRETRSLYAQMGEAMNLLRLRWLEGKLAQADGGLPEAAVAYLEVRDAFVARGLGFDAALASLDLATVYLDQGRTDEIRGLASQMMPIFRALRVHREALAALLVFRRAVAMEQLTLGVIREVTAALEEARRRRPRQAAVSSP